MTAPYDFIHERLWIIFGDYGHVKPLSILSAAAIGSIITLPFDNARTRLMQMHIDPTRNKINYTKMVDVFRAMSLFEGHRFSPWIGFYPYYQSMLIYTYLTIEICDSATTAWKKGRNL